MPPHAAALRGLTILAATLLVPGTLALDPAYCEDPASQCVCHAFDYAVDGRPAADHVCIAVAFPQSETLAKDVFGLLLNRTRAAVADKCAAMMSLIFSQIDLGKLSQAERAAQESKCNDGLGFHLMPLVWELFNVEGGRELAEFRHLRGPNRFYPWEEEEEEEDQEDEEGKGKGDAPSRRRSGTKRRWGRGLLDLSTSELAAVVSDGVDQQPPRRQCSLYDDTGSTPSTRASNFPPATIEVLTAIRDAAWRTGKHDGLADEPLQQVQGSPPPHALPHMLSNLPRPHHSMSSIVPNVTVIISASVTPPELLSEWLDAALRLRLRLVLLCDGEDEGGDDGVVPNNRPSASSARRRARRTGSQPTSSSSSSSSPLPSCRMVSLPGVTLRDDMKIEERISTFGNFTRNSPVGRPNETLWIEHELAVTDNGKGTSHEQQHDHHHHQQQQQQQQHHAAATAACSEACLSTTNCTAFEHRFGSSPDHGNTPTTTPSATCHLYLQSYDDYDAPLFREVESSTHGNARKTVTTTSGIKSCAPAAKLRYGNDKGRGDRLAGCISRAALRLAQTSPFSDVLLWHIPGRRATAEEASADARKLVQLLRRRGLTTNEVTWWHDISSTTNTAQPGAEKAWRRLHHRTDSAWKAWRDALTKTKTSAVARGGGDGDGTTSLRVFEAPSSFVSLRDFDRRGEEAASGVDCVVLERLSKLAKVAGMRQKEGGESNSNDHDTVSSSSHQFAVVVDKQGRVRSQWPGFAGDDDDDDHNNSSDNKKHPAQDGTQETGEQTTQHPLERHHGNHGDSSRRPSLRVVALMDGHDCSLALAVGAQIKLALELERVTGLRYYQCAHESPERYEAVWQASLRTAVEHAALPADSLFDVALSVGTVMRTRLQLYSQVNAKRWVHVQHHRSHATHAFVDSPFRVALVLSYDAAGDDGHFNVYLGFRDEEGTLMELQELARFTGGLGYQYAQFGLLFPEIVGEHKSTYRGPGTDEDKHGEEHEKMSPPSRRAKHDDEQAGLDAALYCHFEVCEAPLHIPGRLMGYSATGQPSDKWMRRVRLAYFGLSHGLEAQVMPGFHEVSRLPSMDEWQDHAEVQRELAATVQAALEDIVVERLRPFVEALPHIEGIVLTGGCALNIKVNSRVQRDFGMPVWTTSSPHDGGLAVGAAWTVAPPPRDDWQPLQFLGMWPVDVGWVRVAATAFGATRSPAVADLARLLADDKIVGVVRGRQEFGPRALGHRSLLASPRTAGMRERLNRLKRREWYRPVAPMVTDTAQLELFTEPVSSPFMNFAAPLTDEACAAFPAICHYDQTARPQTVTADDDPWLYALLEAVGRLIGSAILGNTSFNTHGRPIINSAREALALLRDEADLDVVLLEDAGGELWLFSSEHMLRGGAGLGAGTTTDAMLDEHLPISNQDLTRGVAPQSTSNLVAPRGWG